MSGDLTLYEPGERVSVVVEADGSGNVPEVGDAVAVVGESNQGVHVSFPASAGDGVALLSRTPSEYDSSETYNANEEIGDAMVRLRHPVDWFVEGSAYTATVGDRVVSDTDGTVRAYDNAGGDTVDLILGVVWRTIQHAEGTADKVAVIRHR